MGEKKKGVTGIEKLDLISEIFTQDLIQDISSLHNCPKLHDVIFKTCDGDNLAVAHKTVLGTRSKYWHEYFSASTSLSSSTTLSPSLDTTLSDKDITSIVIVESPEAFLSVLKYMYTGRCAQVPMENLPSVIALAKKYELCELVLDVTKKFETKKREVKTEPDSKDYKGGKINSFLNSLRLPYGELSKNAIPEECVYPFVNFEVEGHLYRASPLLLVARSNYFSTMFCYRWSEALSISYGPEEKKKAPIILEQIPQSDFEVILNFVHTGQITLAASGAENLKKLFRLMEWGMFFQMKSFLAALSYLTYKYYVNTKSVCLIWNLAEDYPDQEMADLMEKCLEYFQREFVACTVVAEAKEHFFTLKKHLLKSALDSGLINADYRIMAQVIREWANANAIRLSEPAASLEAQLLPPSTLFNLANRRSILGVGPRPNQLPSFLAAR